MLTTIFTVLAVIVAVAATVLAMIFIIPESKREHLGSFGKFIHDLCNFKFLVIEKILKALYIFTSVFAVIYGFLNIFCFWTDWNGNLRWNGLMGIAIMILGPIVVRIAYELTMLMILLTKNTISINNKIKGDGKNGDDIFDIKMPEKAPKAPKAPAYQAPVNNQYQAPVNQYQAPVNPAPQAPVNPTPQAPVNNAPQAPAENAPLGSFCGKCGAPLAPNGKCPNCNI